VLADETYDAHRIRELIQDQGATRRASGVGTPALSNALPRNLIERFCSKLAHFRGLITRYDKLAANFLAMAQLASIRLWLRCGVYGLVFNARDLAAGRNASDRVIRPL
jgi:transposase